MNLTDAIGWGASAILIATLFVTALLHVEVAWAITLIFIACLSCLVASLVESIRDVNQSLHALKLELGERT